MSTGEEALRTEEVAQPGEGARAGVLQTAREDGDGAHPSSDEGGAGMVSRNDVRRDYGKDAAARQKSKRGDGAAVLREVRLTFNARLRSRCGRR